MADVVKKKGFEALSRREREVFHLLKFGLSNKDVAQRCGFGLKTAETHSARINKKLGIHSRVELVLFAVREGLLDREILAAFAEASLP